MNPSSSSFFVNRRGNIHSWRPASRDGTDFRMPMGSRPIGVPMGIIGAPMLVLLPIPTGEPGWDWSRCAPVFHLPGR